MSKYPIVIVMITFIMGLFCALVWQFGLWLWLAGGGLFLCLAVFFYLKRNRLNGSAMAAFSVLMALFFVAGGRMQIREDQLQQTLQKLPWYHNVDFTANIVELNQANTKNKFLYAKIKLISSAPDLRIPMKYTFSAVIDSSMHITQGDEISARGRLFPLKAPQIRGDADFRSISLSKGTIGEFNISKAQKTGQFKLPLDQRIRSQISNELIRLGMSESIIGYTMALVFGQKGGLDGDIKRDYRLSGAMHLLVVSGLHVGIFAAIFMFFTLPLKNKKWIRAVVLLVLVWGYAYITGMSPSVSRAVTMFSVMILTGVFTGTYVSVNALAFSALINLMIHPQWVLGAGFQMSYWAALMIILTAPILYRKTSSLNPLCRFFVLIIGVSTVAQIALLPFMLYYFDYVNILSPLANLVLIPLVGYAILPLGMTICCISMLGLKATFLMNIYEYLVNLSVKVAGFFAAQKEVIVEDVGVDLVGFMLMCLVIGALVLFYGRRILGAYMILLVAISACMWSIFKDADKPYIAYEDKKMMFLSGENKQIIPENTLAFVGDQKYVFCPKKDQNADVIFVRMYFEPNKQPRTIVILPDARAADVLRWNEYCVKNNAQIYDMREKGFYVFK